MKHFVKPIYFFILICVCISCNKQRSKSGEISELNVVSKFDEIKAQKEGFQIFKNENFIIKCDGKLELDQERIEYFKQNNPESNATPFHVYVNNIDYNINVTNMSSMYEGISKNELIKYQNEDLDNYETNLKNNGIIYERGKLKKTNCIYYENTQENIITKAVFFEIDSNAYLLQVTSKEKIDKLFNKFINSSIHLKQLKNKYL
jgi:hypothetical protein